MAELLQDLLVESENASGFLNELAAFSARNVAADQKVLCGIVLERERRIAVVASSDDEAARMDEIQAGFDEGPCLEAMRTDTLIRVPDVRSETRWPDYMAVVRAHGLRSVLGIPLSLAGTARAAMNVYTMEPHGFDDDSVALAEMYAAHASKAVLLALRIATHSEAAENRRAAMESRTPIDIAVGIVMGQNRCDRDEAFDILRRASSRRNIKVRDLAAELIATVSGGSPSTVFDG